MEQNWISKWHVYFVRNRHRRILHKFVQVMACIVVFCTTYALILPAITMEKKTFCGLEEHSHSEICYQQSVEKKLICTAQSLGLHVHMPGCYNEEHKLQCGQADYVVHSHDASCYTGDRELVCTLMERSAHVHDTGCYAAASKIPHSHIESCYTRQKGELICTLEEYIGHNHADDCYVRSDELKCGLTENHVHGDSCYTYPLICTLSTEAHTHDDSCYTIVDASSDESEQSSAHSDTVLSCGKVEGSAHEHGDGCYSTESHLICPLIENHCHEDQCFEKVLNCEIPEDPGHSHAEECYHWETVVICGYEEGEMEQLPPVLICTEPVPQIHIHTDSCFEITESAPIPSCGSSSDDHIHTESCYTIDCGQEAHAHSLACYSDPEADLESRETWEATFSQVELSGDRYLDVIAIAETQLGYVESTRNYAVWDDNSVHGYTRYGAWYGVPYGDWCGMFVSFCLRYAGVDNIPINYGVRPWIEDLTELELYHSAADYTPKSGDIVFFDWESDGLSDHVGFVYEIIEATDTEPAKLKTIEGNSSNRVQYVTYELNDPVLLGYSILPEKEQDEVPVYYCGLEEHTHQENICFADDGSLLCNLTEHVHSAICTQEHEEYICGREEHTHIDTCVDGDENLICILEEHIHTSLCLVDLSDLDDVGRESVEKVIRLIDEIPSADEIDIKILEFEDAEDYDGEEIWLTEVYQNIGFAYAQFVSLPEELQLRVINREKLLELEYIWSMMPLATYYVWLDGTNGGLMSLYGSDNTRYTLTTTGRNPYEFTLPQTWKSPSKYQYTLRGWYDIYNREYYNPGDRVTIDRNTVFYADWEAASYNLGQFDAHVVDTVSTNSFVTTRLFDYSGIFNMYSVSMKEGNVAQGSHSEQWNAVSKGSDLSNGEKSLGIILRDWDSGGPKQNSWPSNWSDSSQSHNTSQDNVTFGLYDAYNMYDLFFNPNSRYMGKEYLGTADYLFQYEKDPNSPYYGFYYYDSARNAASYNQSAGRFYVYDYLERTTTSQDNDKDSDFLPFNSPYVNITSGNNPVVSTSSSGQTIYTFDSGSSNSGMSGTNFWFGMTTDIRFYLPNVPGQKDAYGDFGNQSMYGQDMEFRFSGDDDVFVLVDGQLVLDIGGMHDIKSGAINFSTGVVTVESSEQTSKTAYLKQLQPGEHTLTLLYMERGSSMSNCSIYFNISPRFTMSLQKEDTLTNELLNGAEFQVFMDEQCTNPAMLWPSYEAYQQNKDETTNTFTVTNGTTSIWGFAIGNTYYIKETGPPDNGKYLIPNGLIKMELSNKGIASYSAKVIADPKVQEGDNPSPGFKVEFFSIDEENHIAHLVINNSVLAGETKELVAQKIWAGGESTPVTIYLLADGKRIQEEILNDENNWQHRWYNLPVYHADGVTPVEYSVVEGTVPGFTGTITELKAGETMERLGWVDETTFKKGETYLLSTSSGYLAAANNKLYWTADADSSAAQWTLESISGEKVQLRNADGYYLREKVSWSGNDNYFFTNKTAGTTNYRNSRFFFTRWSSTLYLTHNVTSNGHIEVATSNEAVFTLKRKTTVTVTAEEDLFLITNTPIPESEQVSLTIKKIWTDRDGQTPFPDVTLYQEIPVPVKLLANGVDTGQIVRLSLRNNWTYTFAGLPKNDANGPIDYSVVEDWQSEEWSPQYKITQTGSSSYTAEVNNVYSKMLSIPVEKIWHGLSNPDVQNDILVQLYTAAGENQAGSLVGELTLSAANNWKGSFQALPMTEIQGSYYIYEPTTLYTAVYNEKTKIFINGEAKTVGYVAIDGETGFAIPQMVTNYARERLPETGGSGTTLYTAGGLLLSAAALYLLYNNIVKRRKEARPAS